MIRIIKKDCSMKITQIVRMLGLAFVLTNGFVVAMEPQTPQAPMEPQTPQAEFLPFVEGKGIYKSEEEAQQQKQQQLRQALAVAIDTIDELRVLIKDEKVAESIRLKNVEYQAILDDTDEPVNLKQVTQAQKTANEAWAQVPISERAKYSLERVGRGIKEVGTAVAGAAKAGYEKLPGVPLSVRKFGQTITKNPRTAVATGVAAAGAGAVALSQRARQAVGQYVPSMQTVRSAATQAANWTQEQIAKNPHTYKYLVGAAAVGAAGVAAYKNRDTIKGMFSRTPEVLNEKQLAIQVLNKFFDATDEKEKNHILDSLKVALSPDTRAEVRMGLLEKILIPKK